MLPAAAHIAFDQTSLALAVVTLALSRIKTVAAVLAADAIYAEFLLDTEGRTGKAAVMGIWVAHGAIAADTEAIKSVALAVVQTGYAFHATIGILSTEWGIPFAAGVIA